jgi:hypothetical protein
MSSTIKHLVIQLKRRFPGIEEEYAENLLNHFIEENISDPLNAAIYYIEWYRQQHPDDGDDDIRPLPSPPSFVSTCMCCKRENECFFVKFFFFLFFSYLFLCFVSNDNNKNRFIQL